MPQPAWLHIDVPVAVSEVELTIWAVPQPAWLHIEVSVALELSWARAGARKAIAATRKENCIFMI